jgi:preprotein translocase subunit SecF
MGKRRFRRLKHKKSQKVEEKPKEVQDKPKDDYHPVLRFYRDNSKRLLLIPLIILLLSFAQIGYNTYSTGEFVNKGVTLKGGITLTIPYDGDLNPKDIQRTLVQEYPQNDLTVKLVRGFQGTSNLIIEVDLTTGDDATDEETGRFIEEIEKITEVQRSEYKTEITGPSLSQQFFYETIIAVIIAFLFMGLVVFFYFSDDGKAKLIATLVTIFAVFMVYYSGSVIFMLLAALSVVGLFYVYIRFNIPSMAVILSALSDIVVTVAVVNMLGIKVSSAGIAAFLMLIGYSVDTDILLSNRVMKRKGGTVFSRILDAAKTGLTMSGTTMVALIIALTLSQSVVISQIMTILLIGLIVDLMNTWIMNAGLLKWFMERTKNER